MLGKKNLQNPTANTVLSVNIESTPFKIKNKTGCLLSSLLFNNDLEAKSEYKKA